MAEAPANRAQDRSLGQLFASASHDLSQLVRDEIELAKAEVRQEVKAAATGGAMFVVAGVFVLIAVVVGSIAAAHGLHALGLTFGWSYLIVTGAYLLVALVLALVGVRVLKRIRPPERTIRTAKENVSLIKRGNGSTTTG